MPHQGRAGRRHDAGTGSTGGAVTGVSVTAASWFFALVFLGALRHKVRSWPRFRASLAAYRLVPEESIGFVAGLLVLLEGWVGVALLGVERIGLIGAALLLCLYMCAILANLLRGRREIDCGCGDEPTPLSYGLVLRNLALAGAAALASTSEPQLVRPDWHTGPVAAGAALIGYVIYMTGEQLMMNRARFARLNRGAA